VKCRTHSLIKVIPFRSKSGWFWKTSCYNAQQPIYHRNCYKWRSSALIHSSLFVTYISHHPQCWLTAKRNVWIFQGTVTKLYRWHEQINNLWWAIFSATKGQLVATTEGLCGMLCQLKSCQLLHRSTKNPFEKTLKVAQGHWNCGYLIRHTSFPIHGL